MATMGRSIAIRRFLAFGVDWLVIALWAGLLFAAVMIIFSGQPPRPSGPWHSQIIGFTVMTIPVVLYFTFSESSRAQATLGKRVFGLRVSTRDQSRLSVGTSFLRNCIKFAPWELGHIVANQAALSTSGITGWVYLPLAFAFILPVWWGISIFVRGYAPYDAIASTRVVRPSLLFKTSF